MLCACKTRLDDVAAFMVVDSETSRDEIGAELMDIGTSSLFVPWIEARRRPSNRRRCVLGNGGQIWQLW
jgi:hypothetical protein